MEFIHNVMKKKFIFGIKSNRLIALSEEDKKRGQYHNLNTLPIKDGEKVVWLNDLSFPAALTVKIFKNEDGSTGTLYLVTNDLENSCDRIYKVYQKRWRKEYHKSIKQKLALRNHLTKWCALRRIIFSHQSSVIAS